MDREAPRPTSSPFMTFATAAAKTTPITLLRSRLLCSYDHFFIFLVRGLYINILTLSL